MKAAVFYGDHSIKLENGYPTPSIRDNEVLIRVKACGVCGTDLHIYAGAQGATDCNPPVILGHEISGIAEAVGERVTRVKPGDHVTVNPNIFCEACAFCRSGKPHLCDTMKATGVNFDGGFAQYCKVLEKQVYRVRDEIQFPVAAMSEPLSCCLHGIDLLGLQAGGTVMVIGGGTIGMIMLQLAVLSGASKTVLLEINEARFPLARKLGADVVINPQRNDAGAVLADNGIRNIDAVIECAGHPTSVQDAIRYAGRGGKVMLFGLTEPGCSVPFYPFAAFQKELTILSSFVNPDTQERAVGLINAGKLRLEELIGERISLDEIQKAFAPGPRNGKTIVLP